MGQRLIDLYSELLVVEIYIELIIWLAFVL
jgi:hypothetical protein